MNREEKRKLREIERALEADDPGLAKRITAEESPPRRGWSRAGVHIALLGAVMVLFGILFSPSLAWAGFLLLLVGFWLWLIMSGPTSRPASGDLDGGGRRG